VNQTFFTNDRNFLQTYNGLEITATKRMSNNWQVLAGYTFGQTRQEGLSVSTNPNNFINAEGPVTGQIGDRPHQFKLTGTYITPWYDIGLAGNVNMQSGIAVTRQVNTAQTVGGNTTVNVEPLGSERLDARTAMDLRVFKTARFGRRDLSVAVDFNNMFNVNTAWDARTLSGTINLRQNGDPNGAINTVPQFLSPAQVYPPRNVRFNVSFNF
jgi:outer membrane receptor for ferric coprogen and ferric-rhodotorulic acid